MGEPAQTIPWTYEDYLLFPEDGKRYEIVEGDCFMARHPGRGINHEPPLLTIGTGCYTVGAKNLSPLS